MIITAPVRLWVIMSDYIVTLDEYVWLQTLRSDYVHQQCDRIFMTCFFDGIGPLLMFEVGQSPSPRQIVPQ